MPQRRLFSPQIVESDAFLDMPLSSQALYFHLSMFADDDGFIGNPKRVMKMIGANEDDLKILGGKRFILSFPTGVIVIKHWLINNWIRPDRYKETKYTEEKSLLNKKENGIYTERQPNDIPNDNQMTTNGMPQVKLSQVKLSKDKLRESGDKSPTPSEIAKDFFNNEAKRKELGLALADKYNVDIQTIASEIRKFTLYWTELNKLGIKQRWEIEKTFEVGRRLEKWFSNIRQFNKPNEKKGVSI